MKHEAVVREQREKIRSKQKGDKRFEGGDGVEVLY